MLKASHICHESHKCHFALWFAILNSFVNTGDCCFFALELNLKCKKCGLSPNMSINPTTTKKHYFIHNCLIWTQHNHWRLLLTLLLQLSIDVYAAYFSRFSESCKSKNKHKHNQKFVVFTQICAIIDTPAYLSARVLSSNLILTTLMFLIIS